MDKGKVSGYGKIYNLGHAALACLFETEVIVEEKIDGSQFSFKRVGDQVYCRSHRQQLVLDGPQKMFELGINTVIEIAPLLHDGWVYRGEYLKQPHHNTLFYERIPEKHIIIFDIDRGGQRFLTYDEKHTEADRIGLETVPLMYEGMITNVDEVLKLMENSSVLGNSRIEGLVFKNYARWGEDGKCLMGKHVSEEFKEVHKKSFREENPAQRDILYRLIKQYSVPARWLKVVQHLREDNKLTMSPQDIGPLLKELNHDIDAECRDEIKEELYKWARKDIMRGAAKGFPEWYKNWLMKRQFEEIYE